MSYYLIKIFITTVLVVLIAEISKRSSFVGELLASVPLVSVLAMLWLYIDTQDAAKVSTLATSVFWLVLPSLALFLVLPVLLKQGMNFYLSMGIATGVTIACYGLMITLLGYFGVRL